jgi:nitrate/nitrite transport system substrate-binding protein
VEKNPKAAKALTMAVIEAQRWSDNPAEPQGIVRDRGAAGIFQGAGRRHYRPHLGSNRLWQRQESRNFPYLMKFWNDLPLILSRATSLVHHRGYALGLYAARHRHQGW